MPQPQPETQTPTATEGGHKHSWRRIKDISRLRPLGPGLFKAARALAARPGYGGTLFCRCGAARVPAFSVGAAEVFNAPVLTAAGLLSKV